MIETRDYRGVEVLAAYRHIRVTPEWGWGMVVKVDKEELFAPYRQHMSYSFLLGLGGIFAVIGLTIILGRGFTRPILSLSRTADKIAGGDLDARASVSTSDEVGHLTVTFNLMIERLKGWQKELEQQVHDRTSELNKINKDLRIEITERKQAEEALRESTAKFGSIYDQSPIGIELYDSEGNLVNANSKCLEIFGIRNVAAVQGFKLFEDPNISNEVKKRILSGEVVSYESEFDFDKVRELELYETGKTGKTFVRVFLSPWKTSSDDDQGGFLVHVMDITESKKGEEELEKHREHLEELVKERTFELKEKNAELERMNDVFVGREFRIKELSDRVKELEFTIVD